MVTLKGGVIIIVIIIGCNGEGWRRLSIYMQALWSFPEAHEERRENGKSPGSAKAFHGAAEALPSFGALTLKLIG